MKLSPLVVTLAWLGVWIAALPSLAEDVAASQTWRPLLSEPRAWKLLPGTGQQQVQASKAGVKLNSTSKDSVQGTYLPESLAGHFVLEAEMSGQGAYGLALYAEKEGKPDPDNYLIIELSENEAGVPTISVRDNQEGQKAIFDATGELFRAYEEKFPRKKKKKLKQFIARRYQHQLDGAYSMPFDQPDGRLKFVRNALSNSFYLYYGVTMEVNGEERQGWLEFPPVKDWLGEGSTWYPALVVEPKAGRLSDLEAASLQVRTPLLEDPQPKKAVFAVQERPYTWSGYDGEATVITFDEAFPYAKDGIQFVFWDRTNFVPVWHFHNQLLFTYEFVETWDEKGQGCYEPMSDRLHAYTRVEIVEDNAVRKRVRWNYALINPDYRLPRDREGEQVPEVEEVYTFYPDGRIIRHITYRPKLDSSHRHWHELAELIPIAGNQSEPEEWLRFPAVSLFNENLESETFFPGEPRDMKKSMEWELVMASVHLKDEPDAFIAVTNATDLPDVNPQLPISADVSWHKRDYRMSHWPVGLEPYQLDDKTHGDWKSQVSHTAVMGLGAYKGVDWQNWLQKDADGRAYREWAALLSLLPHKDRELGLKMTQGWLYPGRLGEDSDRGVKVVGIDRQRGEVQLSVPKSGKRVALVWEADPKAGVIYKPCFCFNRVKAKGLSIKMNGRDLIEGKDYRFASDEKGLLCWLDIESTDPLQLEFNWK